MKHYLLPLFVLMACCIMAVGQTVPPTKVPAAILNRIGTDFPGHANDKWYMVSSGVYRDSFTLNGKSAVAKYDIEGKCWEQQQEIALAQLPPIVVSNFQKAFAGYTFKSAIKVETKYKDRPLTYIVSLVSPKANKYGYKELLQVGYSADGKSNAIFKSESKE